MGTEVTAFSPKRQLELLRRFEPVIRFTRGEKFFPMDVESYIRSCSLWVKHHGEEAMCLIPQGELTLERLAEPRSDGFNSVYYLRFIEPLDLRRLIEYFRLRDKYLSRETFRFGFGRLARVGYSSRFADLIFSLSLLLRGRVPGDTSVAAVLEYRRIMEENEGYSYHGRAIRQGDWVILQYWFFYAFNNWRSGFFGVNDHESDWESINIYLYESDQGEYLPQWVAYSSHDFIGDDLRRRWDDPELEKVDGHPVIYPGVGSHACYFTPGEYLAELELPFLSPLARGLNRVISNWRKVFGLSPASNQDEAPARSLDILRVPFVDYARGDGMVIGPGGQKEWGKPRLLEPAPGWVSQFTGLWGLYTRDLISGENAPSGPMYNRDGSVRLTWYDPLHFAGLDKVPPPCMELKYVKEEIARLSSQGLQISQEIEQRRRRLNGLGVLGSAIRDHPEFRMTEKHREQQIEKLSSELVEIRAQKVETEKLIDVLEYHADQIRAGYGDPIRGHLHRPYRPASPQEIRANRIVELWAALSIGLMLIGFVGLVIFYRQHVILGLVVMISLFVFIESGFRRQLEVLINSLAISLAMVAALVIFFEYFWQIVILSVFFAGIYILWENVREFFVRR
jgi:hypothetical protein